MPEVTIHIGGRDFQVSCQEGEESFLTMAAGMLDDEAQVLSDQIGRMPEARMLLMAGLMLADKTAAVEDRIKVVEAELAERDAMIAQKEAEIEELRNAPPPEPEKVEVPVVPPQVYHALTELVARTEYLAHEIEAKAAPDEEEAEAEAEEAKIEAEEA
ncbi:cell division protein ZapA [Arenibacterium sp. LLYu02]|uniref:cell division protein ZapA n=1 Tax=Arenibacterium sp. LLYu02 TaxID=3404132 RepID=UPI003B21E443